MCEQELKARPLPVLNEGSSAKFTRELIEHLRREVKPVIQEFERITITFRPEDLITKY
ncbi:MAG: hypothetical protein Q7R49_02210 [Candidatus Daviesbacteria bacterium]|nr:hypothetical protein [Candidatus Daviesbacteria bacterium]